ncbi:unnamed protein product [Gadus morhua 'NCC']
MWQTDNGHQQDPCDAAVDDCTVEKNEDVSNQDLTYEWTRGDLTGFQTTQQLTEQDQVILSNWDICYSKHHKSMRVTSPTVTHPVTQRSPAL